MKTAVGNAKITQTKLSIKDLKKVFTLERCSLSSFITDPAQLHVLHINKITNGSIC